MKFLSLAPTTHVEAKVTQPDVQLENEAVIEQEQPIEIPAVEKTARSDSNTTDASSIVSPRGSIDDGAAAEIKRQLQNQFLKLGN